MEPTNKTERQSAIKRFAGIYVLSLLFPLIASFFMFSKPSGALKDENQRLKTELEKQAKLIQSLDSLTAQSIDLQRLDKEIELLSRDSSRTLELSEKKKQSDAIESSLRAQVQEIRKDTATMEQGLNRRLASSFTNAFEALITYRYNIASFRSMLGPNAKCATELAYVKRENDELKRDMQKMAQANGSGKNDCMAYIYQNSQLQAETKQLTADVNAYKNSIGTYTNKIDELEEKLKAAKANVPATVPSTGASEAEMAEARGMAQLAEIDCLLKQADPRVIISDDKQRLKFASSALQKISEAERSSNGTINNLSRQKKAEYTRIINDIKRGKG
jgi:DNA repair exonuclease SbcCD ATPase subunit